jgi:hypothetical protein
MARLVAAEGKHVVDSPAGAGASSEIEFDSVFVLIEPNIEQKGLESHRRTSEDGLLITRFGNPAPR